MRVLIIGASGAVGTHLTWQLTGQGQEVTGTCRSASKEDRILSLASSMGPGCCHEQGTTFGHE